jgi:hypothetical protein
MRMRRRRSDDSDSEVIKDGGRIRVPLMMRDGMLTDSQLAELPDWQRDVILKWRARGAADAYGAYPAGAGAKEGGACTIDGRPGKLRKQSDGSFVCVPDGSDDAIATTSPAVVADAFGDSGAGLHRPGFRYLHAGVKSVDHAVQAVRDLERREAFADSVVSLQDAWKAGADDREVARVHNTGNPVADAYLDGVADLTTAWSRGSGRR